MTSTAHGGLVNARRLEPQESRAANSLEARIESLIASEAQTRTRADQLAEEVVDLRSRLAWRTIALEILLLGVACITAVIWITRWWPWT